MNIPALSHQPLLLLDQELDPDSPLERLTVTATWCDFYRRGFIDIFLPPTAHLSGVVGNQVFDNTTEDFLKSEAQRLFDDLLARLIQQRQQEGLTYVGQRIFHLD